MGGSGRQPQERAARLASGRSIVDPRQLVSSPAAAPTRPGQAAIRRVAADRPNAIVAPNGSNVKRITLKRTAGGSRRSARLARARMDEENGERGTSVRAADLAIGCRRPGSSLSSPGAADRSSVRPQPESAKKKSATAVGQQQQPPRA
jgi:hypothetical protein